MYYFSINKKTSFFIGWLFGFGYFLSNTYWISHSLTFEHSYSFLIPFSLILLPAFLGLFYGFATLLIFILKLSKNLKSILLFSLIFSVIEFIRGLILTGFPWNLHVFSLSNFINSIQLLSYVGTYTLNLLVITIFLLPLTLTFDKPKIYKILSLSILFLIIILNDNFGLYKINKFNQKLTTELDMKLKIISPNIKIERYFSGESPLYRLQEIIDLSNPQKRDNGEIFIFPEGILVGINLSELKNYKQIFEEKYSDKDLLVFGINSKKKGKIYNSLVILDKHLNVLGKYDKNNLVPFGEFLPFEGLFLKIGIKKITSGYTSFSSSNKRQLIELNNVKFLPLICYEIIYSGNLNYNNENYDLIINISEDGWFGNSIGPYQHFSHSVFRAIEEGKNIVRSSNNGISGLVDPTGNLLKTNKSTESSVIYINNLRYSETTYFSKYGNKIFFYFVLIYITLIFFLQRKDL